MLKSFSTQLAATLFFGPLGLAYCSVATAVFLTLVLAVLLFSDLGVLSLLLIWPLSMLIGMVFVKLHNDQIRSSGSRLLLGPGEEYEDFGTAGAWGRGIAVLTLLMAGGFITYLYTQPGTSQDIGRIVSSDPKPPVAPVDSAFASSVVVARADTSAPGVAAPSGIEAISVEAETNDNGADNIAVIALPERDVATVIIDNDGNVEQGETNSALNSGRPELTVSASVVNLRRGPGTSFEVITTVRSGQKLFEFARDGDWINVETVSGAVTGWIYGDLVR